MRKLNITFSRLLVNVYSISALSLGIMFPLLASSSPISNQTVLGTQSSQTFAKISPEMPIDDKNNPNSVYAFGSYLGTGIYRAAEQNATIVSIPLVFDFFEGREQSDLAALTTILWFF